jgi:NAD(P)-dependent dehydrogenase (short-subunit alcohol dehydrogenase family)
VDTSQAAAPVALVVGGASGIGRATADELVAAGWRVAVADLRADALDDVSSRIARLPVDVRSPESVDAAVAACDKEFGRLDALVYAAGIVDPGLVVDASDEAWARMFDVHVNGAHRFARASHALLARSDAAAVCLVSSIAARIGLPYRVSYNAAKSAVEGMTRGLATEWAPDGIRVNCVAPGYTETPLMRAAAASGTLNLERLTTRIPQGRLAEPAEIARAIAFVVGPHASYITGQTITVDGGLTTGGDWS